MTQVVANTVAALTDIHTIATSGHPPPSPSDPVIFNITSSILNKLLIALNECSEWGRVAILNALARYNCQDEKESEHICERVVPQFQHVNGSVVLAAVKVSLSLFRLLFYDVPFLGHHDTYAWHTAGRSL
jgi:AP-1 complex subunit beta-1